MRIVLLGSSGQVGWELQRALAPVGEVVALRRAAAGGLCGDLERPDDLRRAVRVLRPQVVVNAAAYTDVERAESEPDRALRINAEAPGVLAMEAERLGAWLVHYSTDYVFDGSGADPWREGDVSGPLCVYGSTKWQGEQAVRDTGCRHLLFRTQWVYASRGRNFLRTILRRANAGETLRVIDDQYGAPTGADLIADVTAHALRAAMTRQDVAGTYHLAARGETTWYAYARFLIDSARSAGWPIPLTDDAIVPVASEAFATAARRPQNARLDVERLERTFDLRLPDWRPGVARAVAELYEAASGRE